jgi:hypothetical protein
VLECVPSPSAPEDTCDTSAIVDVMFAREWHTSRINAGVFCEVTTSAWPTPVRYAGSKKPFKCANPLD